MRDPLVKQMLKETYKLGFFKGAAITTLICGVVVCVILLISNN